MDLYFVVFMTFPLSSETPDVKHSRNIASLLYNWLIVSFRLLVMLIKSQLCDLYQNKQEPVVVLQNDHADHDQSMLHCVHPLKQLCVEFRL